MFFHLRLVFSRSGTLLTKGKVQRGILTEYSLAVYFQFYIRIIVFSFCTELLPTDGTKQIFKIR